MSQTFRAYHGTDAAAAESIKQTGFRAGSYFAFRREHAILHGGLHVFTVELPSAGLNRDTFEGPEMWQFHTLERIPPSAIVGFEVVVDWADRPLRPHEVPA